MAWYNRGTLFLCCEGFGRFLFGLCVGGGTGFVAGISCRSRRDGRCTCDRWLMCDRSTLRFCRIDGGWLGFGLNRIVCRGFRPRCLGRHCSRLRCLRWCCRLSRLYRLRRRCNGRLRFGSRSRGRRLGRGLSGCSGCRGRCFPGNNGSRLCRRFARGAYGRRGRGCSYCRCKKRRNQYNGDCSDLFFESEIHKILHIHQKERWSFRIDCNSAIRVSVLCLIITKCLSKLHI